MIRKTAPTTIWVFLAYLAIIFVGAFFVKKIDVRNIFAFKKELPKVAASIPTVSIVTEKNKSEPPAIQPVQSADFSARPNRIKIPAVGIDIAVREGNYDETTRSWTTSGESAFFAVNSALPNPSGGNTIIYGHNIKQIFGKAKNIIFQDRAFVYTGNGWVYEYAFFANDTVEPQDVSIFSYQGSPRLTLVTCSGLLSEQRRLIYFDLVSYNKEI